jgi:hypothetical protein
MGPTVAAQAIKYPATNVADPMAVQFGNGWQPRVALSYGLLDAYKGLGVMDVARADCAREDAANELRDLIQQKGDIGRVPALERELEVLRERLPEVHDLVAKAEARLAARLSTVVEVAELGRRALEIERKTTEVEGDLDMLSRRHARALRRPVRELLEEYDRSAIAYEDRAAHVRDLDPWKLNATVGVVATPTADVFGIFEVSYNFGGIVRSGAESRYQDARADEIKTARYELHAQVTLLLSELDASVAQMREEVAALDGTLSRLNAMQTALEGSDAPSGAQVLAGLRIESIELEADRAYLAALIEQRSTIARANTPKEGSHASQ